jgi:hypothetical protein
MSMRKDIQELLDTDYDKLPQGFRDIIQRIAELRVTDQERCELSDDLVATDNRARAMLLLIIMRQDPHEAYRGALLRVLESEDRILASAAAETLVHGGYQDAAEAVASSRNAVTALAHDLPRVMLLHAEKLSEDKQALLLEEFFKRVSEHPPLEAGRDWFKMVSMILIQDKRLTPILWQTWQEMPRGQDWLYDRLALLDAMATHPDPTFKPAFEQAARSHDDDLKAIGRTGLHVLSEVAAGRWPFDKPAR